MDVAGYMASILIGISLGLIGGGGSILTVPVLVYLFKVDTLLATTYSLFIVGIASIGGSVSYFKKGQVNIKTAILFGLPSIVAVLLTRSYLLPSIPHNIFTLGNFVLTRDLFILLIFGILMILAAFSMIKKTRENLMPVSVAKVPYLIISLQGIGIGIITGLVGAGGGFLIIPVLVNFVKLPMKIAVGTSLFIIAINSLTGFFFSQHLENIHWKMLLPISSIAIAGIFIGSFLSTRIDSKRLKPLFGWFVLIMGIYIIVKETMLK